MEVVIVSSEYSSAVWMTASIVRADVLQVKRLKDSKEAYLSSNGNTDLWAIVPLHSINYFRLYSKLCWSL